MVSVLLNWAFMLICPLIFWYIRLVIAILSSSTTVFILPEELAKAKDRFKLWAMKKNSFTTKHNCRHHYFYFGD
jgi:hypothetical protein